MREPLAASTDAGKPLVVTSTPPLYSFVANVAGDAVRLENLLPPGASPHQTSFTPAQAKLLAQADLLVINGAGLEQWVGDMIKSTGRQDLKVVEASRGLEFLRPNQAIPVPGSSADTGEPDQRRPPRVARRPQRPGHGGERPSGPHRRSTRRMPPISRPGPPPTPPG